MTIADKIAALPKHPNPAVITVGTDGPVSSAALLLAGEWFDQELAALRARNELLVEALEDAIATIKMWHDSDGVGDVWDLYLNGSPEMKRLTTVLAACRVAP